MTEGFGDRVVLEVEAAEIWRAIDQHQRCGDCRPSLLLVVTRDEDGGVDWGIADAHTGTCPTRGRGC